MDFAKSSVLIFESIFPLWHLLGGYFHLLNVSVIHVWCIDVRQGLCSFYSFAGTFMPDCGKLCEAGFCLLNNSSWGWWWWSVVTMLTLRHLRLDVPMGCSPSHEGQGWMKMRAGLRSAWSVACTGFNFQISSDCQGKACKSVANRGKGNSVVKLFPYCIFLLTVYCSTLWAHWSFSLCVITSQSSE